MSLQAITLSAICTFVGHEKIMTFPLKLHNLSGYYIAIVSRVTQVTKVFPTVTLKGRVFHPDSYDVHISSLK